MIIDTHTHLDNGKYCNILDEVLKRADEKGVKKFIIPAADPNDLQRAIKLSEENENIFFAVGVHPIDVEKYDKKYLLDNITHPKCVAVGEIGLDYHYTKETKEAQIEMFKEQIEIALEYDKPIIVHIREASLDSLNILQAYPTLRGVLHCFNADEQLLKLKENFYYGIGGVITFKNARKLVEVFPKIPKSRVLIETDSPYLTPHPYRGQLNEPSYTTLVAQKIAELWECEVKEVEEITTKNAEELFKI